MQISRTLTDKLSGKLPNIFRGLPYYSGVRL